MKSHNEQESGAGQAGRPQPKKPYSTPTLARFGDIRTRTLAPTKAAQAESGQVEPRRAGI